MYGSLLFVSLIGITKVKKAITGGKLNIKLMLFQVFGGEGFRGAWGELGGKGDRKALKNIKFRQISMRKR